MYFQRKTRRRKSIPNKLKKNTVPENYNDGLKIFLISFSRLEDWVIDRLVGKLII